MRKGKTKRDHQSGAWHNHRQNKELRRFEGAVGSPGAPRS
jgi:hypothetical protein